ncbi:MULTISPECIES: phosphoglycolate phosphatase [Acidianus]|uniref:Phosphoglycolate phosphatase n=1 Tax=Candidatus Acidianus copahuensis TaxID=1160895 RepID=A0A031LM05_9CREN|nr:MULTISPECIES: phosphoglycolate phosphatase [Acidianus]EZQ03176.1 phosphoglycolate phosphatase [Candidatus Acidianus copahuensis]NON61954.1 phosphoglycolate phosphatase [Acidianus sp. RZ1]
MIKLVLSDLDGTLTEERNTYKLNLTIIEKLRIFEENGIKVAIVSGNSFPVLRGLHNYLGFSGGVVAENGCVVFFKSKVKVCKDMDKRKVEEFKERYKVKDSWQNLYKECDFSFTPPELKADMREWANINGMYINSSGYAIHIAFNPAGKNIGVRKLIEMHGLNKNEVAAIGDSLTDLEMFEEVGLKIAVSDAEEELKRSANLIINTKDERDLSAFMKKVIGGEFEYR